MHRRLMFVMGLVLAFVSLGIGATEAKAQTDQWKSRNELCFGVNKEVSIGWSSATMLRVGKCDNNVTSFFDFELDNITIHGIPPATGNQCLQIGQDGVVTGTGSDCATSGGSGTVTKNGSLATNKVALGGTNGTTDIKTDTGCSTNGAGQMTCTGFTGPVTGLASTATALATPRAINGQNFDGTAAVTVPVNNAIDATNSTQYLIFTPTQNANAAARTAAVFPVNPSTGTLGATTFNGALHGIADGNPLITNNGSEYTAATFLANVGAQDKLGSAHNSVTKTGSGNELCGSTFTSLAAGDRVQYDGSKCINAEPGFAYNADTTANLAILTANKGKILTRTNAAMADTIAQAGSAGFDALWYMIYQNVNATVTSQITPATSTCNGVAACKFLPQEGAIVSSDGANYRAQYFMPTDPATGALVAAATPLANIVVTTSTPTTVSTTLNSAYYINEHATAATAITYNLPTAAAGKQFCVSNAYNGSAADTGVLTVATSAAGQFIIFTDGTLSATGGNITSGGAAADAACVVGVDSTHWLLYVNRGIWTKH